MNLIETLEREAIERHGGASQAPPSGARQEDEGRKK
jgi:hypothetical protein